jgi:hypothetical protein
LTPVVRLGHLAEPDGFRLVGACRIIVPGGGRGRGYIRRLAGRLTHVLVAMIFALAVMLPGGVAAVPMPADMNGMGVQQQCPACPEPVRSGTSPDMMALRQLLDCTGAVAALPGAVLLHGRVLLRSAYLVAPPAY